MAGGHIVNASRRIRPAFGNGSRGDVPDGALLHGANSHGADNDMTTKLPNDLIAFLAAGRQFDYDTENSEVGRIALKRDTDLALTTITTFPGCQSVINDPYRDLDGLYHIDVYDLVAESERYETEGLLCWIVALRQFGCIDPEHGDVIVFHGATWTDIAANPRPYLDAQWGDEECAVRVLPWVHFPMKLGKSEALISPYGSRCPIHNAPVTVQRVQKPPLFDVLRRRKLDDWLQSYLTVFPCSGVPITEHELLRCSHCRAAEDAWIRNVDESIVPTNTTPNAHGWVRCPGCGIRFLIADSKVFRNGIHLNCGQKITVVS